MNRMLVYSAIGSLLNVPGTDDTMEELEDGGNQYPQTPIKVRPRWPMERRCVMFWKGQIE